MRILLVEDDPMIGEAVQAALKDASSRQLNGGFAVDQAPETPQQGRCRTTPHGHSPTQTGGCGPP